MPLNLNISLNADLEKGARIQGIEEARDTDKNNQAVSPASQILYFTYREVVILALRLLFRPRLFEISDWSMVRTNHWLKQVLS